MVGNAIAGDFCLSGSLNGTVWEPYGGLYGR